uniref:NADH-ubiquinone oxidoreductase chain 6 n=1 Tax=Mantella madagascariensis TaxID=111290 RepID=Q2HXH1_9NEOB|nr:NADH dehydrogenase subunit 6 [Mantella madagascariensis]BAE79524.1 NADH dehydrogenase subunit 6 [Mantella madagascariensis]
MFMEICLLIGLGAVASNPSPYYAALGLVGGAGVGCVLLAKGGVGFLSLVLFLIYLGGMMVVFAYCAALVAEPYPEAWGSHVVFVYLVVYGFVFVISWMIDNNWKINSSLGGNEVITGEWWGVSELLSSGGWMLFFGGWGLLLTLFIVLEVVRGHKAGTLRAV